MLKSEKSFNYNYTKNLPGFCGMSVEKNNKKINLQSLRSSKYQISNMRRI